MADLKLQMQIVGELEDIMEPQPSLYDFNYPEDVYIEVDHSESTVRRWPNTEIVETVVLGTWDDPAGAASYEYSEGGFLDYTLEDILEPLQPGAYVVEDITAVYHRGQSMWESPAPTDDDMEFYCGNVRPATLEEIADQYGVSFWDTE